MLSEQSLPDALRRHSTNPAKAKQIPVDPPLRRSQVFSELLHAQKTAYAEQLEQVVLERCRKLHERVAELERELAEASRQRNAMTSKTNMLERQLESKSKSQLSFGEMLEDGREKEVVDSFAKFFTILPQQVRLSTLRQLVKSIESKEELQLVLQDLVTLEDKEQLPGLVATAVKQIDPAARYKVLCEVYTMLSDEESSEFIDWLPDFLQENAPPRLLQAFNKMTLSLRATFITSLLNEIGPAEEAVVLEYRHSDPEATVRSKYKLQDPAIRARTSI